MAGYRWWNIDSSWQLNWSDQHQIGLGREKWLDQNGWSKIRPNALVGWVGQLLRVFLLWVEPCVENHGLNLTRHTSWLGFFEQEVWSGFLKSIKKVVSWKINCSWFMFFLHGIYKKNYWHTFGQRIVSLRKPLSHIGSKAKWAPRKPNLQRRFIN